MKRCPARLSACLSLFLSPFFAYAASAAITEIMYDLPGADSGREWVEVQNTGTESVSFAQWRFFEGNTHHGVALFRGEATTSPDGFAVIADDPAKFLGEWPAFAGTVFSSSFSLSNSGEPLALKLEGVVMDEVNYTSALGAAGDGQSLQKTATLWQAGAPTPGAASVIGGASVSATSATGTPSPQTSTSSPASVGASSGGAVSPIEPKIFVGMTAPAHAVAGADALFDATAVGLKKEPLQNARYLWSFGDGGSAEGKRVLHTYHYPGSYVVLVEASSGEWSATERRDIAVTAPTISISRITEGPDGFVELQNSGPDDLDLSRWFLKSSGSLFTFPNGTIIKAHTAVPFPSVITKLAANPEDTVLLYPNGTLAVRYVPSPLSIPVVSPTAVVPNVSPADAAVRAADIAAKQPVMVVAPQREAERVVPVSAPTGELFASVVVSREGSPSRTVTWAAAVAALVLVSVGGYVFASRPPRQEPTEAEKLSREAEEFEIVE